MVEFLAWAPLLIFVERSFRVHPALCLHAFMHAYLYIFELETLSGISSHTVHVHTHTRYLEHIQHLNMYLIASMSCTVRSWCHTRTHTYGSNTYICVCVCNMYVCVYSLYDIIFIQTPENVINCVHVMYS